MPSWTPEQLLEYEQRKNRHKTNYPRQVAIVESNAGGELAAEAQIQKAGTGRFLVRVISVRTRLLDDDNLAEKFLVDECRYAGLIPDDAPEFCKIEVSQRKCQENEPEHVIVEIEMAPTSTQGF